MKNPNKYIANMKRIDFVVTQACNSHCRHCLWMYHTGNEHMEPARAVDLIRRITKICPIDSIMTFGGEPLLCMDTLTAVHREAENLGISQRKLMTNGGISDKAEEIEKQVDQLLASGINKILLSVDTFHMEFIPLRRQHVFAKLLRSKGFDQLFLNPVWVASRENNNLFNSETEECLKVFQDLALPICDGNVIRPEGNGRKYLEKFYVKGSFDHSFRCGSEPGTEKLDQPTALSIDPNGDVSVCSIPIGNVYCTNIEEILESFNPYENPVMTALLSGGIRQLQSYVQSLGFTVDVSDYYTPCEFCHEMWSLQKSVVNSSIK